MKNLDKEILAFVNDLKSGVWEFATTPYGQLRVNKIPKPTLYHSLDRLNKKGLVRKQKLGRRNKYFITESGRKVLRAPLYKPRKTNGLSTMILFDIPNEKNRARDAFRRYLIRNGYTQLQRSVLISPFEITNGIRDLIKELGIRKNVSILECKLRYDF